MHFIFISTGRPAYQPKYIFHLLHRVCAWAGICHSNFHMLYTSVYAQCNMTLHLDFYAWINRQIKQAIVVCTYICHVFHRRGKSPIPWILNKNYLGHDTFEAHSASCFTDLLWELWLLSARLYFICFISALQWCWAIALWRHVKPPHVTGFYVQSRLIFIHRAFVYYVQPRHKKNKNTFHVHLLWPGEVVWSPLCVCAGPLSAACLPVEVTG